MRLVCWWSVALVTMMVAMMVTTSTMMLTGEAVPVRKMPWSSFRLRQTAKLASTLQVVVATSVHSQQDGAGTALCQLAVGANVTRVDPLNIHRTQGRYTVQIQNPCPNAAPNSQAYLLFATYSLPSYDNFRPRVKPLPFPDSLAVDVGSQSRPIPVADFTCLREYGINRVIVRAWRSNGAADPNAVANVQNAWNASMDMVDIYTFTCPSRSAPGTQVRNAVTHMAGQRFGVMWFDLEEFGADQIQRWGRCWSETRATNIASFEAMVQAAQNVSVAAGAYSNRHYWDSLFGNYNGGANLPLWHTHFDGKPDNSDYVPPRIGPFGGWTAPVMKQIFGTSTICNVNLDLNWYIPANVTNTPATPTTTTTEPQQPEPQQPEPQQPEPQQPEPQQPEPHPPQGDGGQPTTNGGQPTTNGGKPISTQPLPPNLTNDPKLLIHEKMHTEGAALHHNTPIPSTGDKFTNTAPPNPQTPSGKF